ncbi:MAG: hypothetical protein V1716_05320 [Candidatus Uhrbacteria bacterium]
MDEQQLMSPKKKKALTKEEKAVLFLLFIVTILGVSFGFKSIPATLSRPFEVQLASYTGADFKTLSQKEEEETARQKTADADNDGLTDYDELYIYKTSPYLSDSDSDGFDDRTEIFSSNNPNCPEGKDCAGASVSSEIFSSDDSGNESSNILSNVFNLGSSDLSGVTFESTQDIQDFLAKMNPEEIRSMLISQGVSKEIVDQMTDEQIKQLLEETIKEATASGALDSILPETDGTAATNPNPFAGMSSEEIRAALIEQGVPKSDLDQLTDDQINQMLDEAYNQASASGTLE